MKILMLGLCLIAGCSNVATTSDAKLRPLTKAEAHGDLNELIEHIKALYGPLEYKEARYNYKLTDLATTAHTQIDAAQSDEETLGVFAQLLAKFDDAHIGIRFPTSASGIASYKINLFVEPFEKRAIITTVGKDLDNSGISVGDEVLAVDGEKPFDLLPKFLAYRHFANPLSDQQFLYQIFSRPAYVTDLKPHGASAHVLIAKADGTQKEVDLTWHTVATTANIPDLVKPTRLEAKNHAFRVDFADEMNAAAGLDKMGAITPFFLTKEVVGKFNPVRVSISADALKKVGLDTVKFPEIYAAIYRYAGKTLLLVRQPTYSHSAPEPFTNDDYMKAYEALLDQYEGIVDGLVLDQTHNGGGSYCEDFFSLFINKQQNAFVQMMNPDRKWILDLQDWAKESDVTLATEESRSLMAMANTVEKAYDDGETLSPPLALMGGRNLVAPHASYTWKKPFIVLVDELSASCADAFPMLIKESQAAKLFGERTVGAGGSIEEVAQLSNSRATVRLTRGLFTTYRSKGDYTSDRFIENNGVQPDYHYAHTVADVRAGFVNYFEEFSKRAVEQIH